MLSQAQNCLHKFQEFIACLFANNAVFIIIMSVTNVLGIYCARFSYSFGVIQSVKLLYHFLIILFLTVLASFLISFLPGKWFRNIVKIIFCSTSVIICITDIFSRIYYDSILDQVKIEILLTIDPYTSLEYLQTYILNPLFLLCTVVFLFILYSLVSAKGRKFFQELFMKKGKVLSVLVLCSIAAFLFMAARLFHDSPTAKQLNRKIRLAFFEHSSIVRVIEETQAASKSVGRDSTIWTSMDRSTEKVIEDNSHIPCLIFVLGESVNRNHMSIYGYRLPTTPYSEQRYKNKELTVFSDVISCQNWTQGVMSMMFNFAEKGHKKPWYTYPNIFDLLKQTEYHTVWLSNQPPVSQHGNTDKIFSARTDEAAFIEYIGGSITGDNDNETAHNYDSKLLPVLDQYLKKNDNVYAKNIYFIHTMGAHYTYSNRYPAKLFGKFSAEDEPPSKSVWQKTQAEYDNAVLYSDYILDEIIKRFESKNAILIYVSDHGMEVYDEGRNHNGHSAENQGVRGMIEVPLFIWVSQSFKQKNKGLVQRINAAKDKPFRTDNMIHLLLDILDIRSTSYKPQKSLINSRYDSSPVRLYNGKPYYKKAKDK